MGVKQVGVGASTSPCITSVVTVRTYIFEQSAEQAVGSLAVKQTGVEICAPAGAPSGGVVPFQFQSFGRGGTQIGILPGGDVTAREYSEQMRLVAVGRLVVIPIVVPFLEVSTLAYLVGV